MSEQRTKPEIRYLDIRDRPSDYFLKTGQMIWSVKRMTLDEIRAIWPDASILPENSRDER